MMFSEASGTTMAWSGCCDLMPTAAAWMEARAGAVSGFFAYGWTGRLRETFATATNKSLNSRSMTGSGSVDLMMNGCVIASPARKMTGESKSWSRSPLSCVIWSLSLLIENSA